MDRPAWSKTDKIDRVIRAGSVLDTPRSQYQ
ncbi:hypothetical protein CCACVL1_03847 [Corchorus capsularis]|uniref:Uncharacterized protein n=1 Tax=Corchorus capsularis TaxID=210143 RepID=A0A1R3JWY0_COCAP|nr:hypothetical protein CCACVL1_03847 [Corchorus capsularis]